MEEKRDYHRVPFKCHSKISIVDRCYACELIDISLRGVLLEIDSEDKIGLGSLCQIDIAFASCDIHLQFDGKLVHQEKNHYGFRIESLEVDSLTHLRRLLELNYGDADEIEREFFHWLRADD
jgi:hypothetical protein